MANDLNQCQFIGRLGQDPEVKHTTGGNVIANISLAVGWKTKDNEGVEWVRVVMFGKTAELAGKYLNKGSRIYVSGRMQTRKWQDRDGADRYTTEVIANQMQFLDSRRDESGGGERMQGRSAPSGGNGADSLEDEIPF